MINKVPLVVIGAYLPQTGFTRVLLSVLSRLPSTYDIHYVGMSYKGPPLHDGRIAIYPCNVRGGDLFGAMQGAALAEAVGARAVLLLNDLWVLKNYMAALAPLRQRLKVLVYAPLDGRLPEASWVAPLVSVDRFVVYTEFARREVRRACAALAASGVTTTFPDVEVIPHGVDAAAFHPLAGSLDAQVADGGRLDARRRLFPDRPELWRAFIVLNANRPVPRKRIDLTIEAFALFARDKPVDVKLYLHHAIMNTGERDQILAWARQHDIVDRLLLPPITGETDPASDAQLNLIYNACDVGLNTAMGEGWGLVSMEHAATGAAQIVPRHSACAELWAEGGVLLDPGAPYVPSFSPLELATIAPADAAHALERLYRDVPYRRRMSAAAWRVATRADYTWDVIAGQWDALVQSTIESGATLRSVG
jgi:D-inositol-3-phosphate glycosyltransferase